MELGNIAKQPADVARNNEVDKSDGGEVSWECISEKADKNEGLSLKGYDCGSTEIPCANESSINSVRKSETNISVLNISEKWPGKSTGESDCQNVRSPSAVSRKPGLQNNQLSLNSMSDSGTDSYATVSSCNEGNLSIDGIGYGFEKLEQAYEASDGSYEATGCVKSGVNLLESACEAEVRRRRNKNSETCFEEVSHVKDMEASDTEKVKELSNNLKDFSLLYYLKVEVTRNYLFEEQGEKYIEQREKVYTFMKTPRELEKLMWFGFLLCLDCFLFVFTYLPVRLLSAVLRLLGNLVCLRFLKNGHSLLEPHHICDLLRGLILIVCCTALENVDLSILYHIVRGQSVIKLYVIYNMLDIADRLFSSIGQDTLDALFWTAAEPREKRSVVRVVLHFGLASVYVFLHAVLVLFQAITLNVAINSHNKVLMVVMISNQFVELKGCVFKKFEKNNLFQMSCADIRERFYYVVLVSLVALRNMHELQWNLDHLYDLLPSIVLLLSSEIFVDWVKHAFITKFNCIPSEVYGEYRELLALDATTSRLFEHRARSDHFDLVSRRLGFIPLPLGCLVYRVTSQSIEITGAAGVVVVVLTYLWLMSVKVLNSIILLGMSCQYVIDKETKGKVKRDEGGQVTDTRPTPPHHEHSVVDPLDRDPKKQAKGGVARKVKTLDEIDRYTLCSNRIV